MRTVTVVELMSLGKTNSVKRILTALTLSAVLASPAWSAMFSEFGHGARTCGELTELHDKQGKLLSAQQWMWGFFTAYNLSKAKNGTESLVGKGKHTGIYAAVILHCRSNPLTMVTDATFEVYSQLD